MCDHRNWLIYIWDGFYFIYFFLFIRSFARSILCICVVRWIEITCCQRWGPTWRLLGCCRCQQCQWKCMMMAHASGLSNCVYTYIFAAQQGLNLWRFFCQFCVVYVRRTENIIIRMNQFNWVLWLVWVWGWIGCDLFPKASINYSVKVQFTVDHIKPPLNSRVVKFFN